MPIPKTEQTPEQRQAQIRSNRLAYAVREQGELAQLMAESLNPTIFQRVQRGVVGLFNIIFNPTVPMAKRARGIDMSHWNNVKNWAGLNEAADIFILKFGGMDMGDGAGALKAYEDVDWSAHVQALYDQTPRKPIEAYFYADADYHLLKQRGLDWVRNQDYKTNEVLIQMITSLHNGAWTWDNLTGDRGWKPIQAIWIDLEETQGWNGKITGAWQAAVLENLLDPLHRLQEMGKLPAHWKLGVYTRPLFIRDDCKMSDGSNPVETYLWNRRTWIYLWLAQWIFPLDPDIQLPSLKDLWTTYIPADTFKFLYVPYQLEDRVWHHQYTGEKFDVPEYTPEVDANLHFNTLEEYYKATGFTGTVPEPPPPPPYEDPDTEARFQSIESRIAELNTKQDADILKLQNVIEWIKSFRD